MALLEKSFSFMLYLIYMETKRKMFIRKRVKINESKHKKGKRMKSQCKLLLSYKKWIVKFCPYSDFVLQTL